MKRVLSGSLALLALTVGLQARIQEKSIQEELRPGFQKIIEMGRVLGKIHPFFKKLYPIAVVEEERFFIFDIEQGKEEYVFVKDVPVTSPVPEGVRAAFPLSFYEDRMACVVTPDALSDTEGLVMIFHEFVHCRQNDLGEQKIKSTLGIARKARADQNVMWEINHPFPYQDELFVEIYAMFLEAVARGDEGMVTRCRMSLREILNDDDFEYLLWQEWKEGFARWMENRARVKLGLEINRGWAQPPFDRVSFYAGGAALIAMLVKADEEMETDLEGLFTKMKSLSF